ncbi:M48 family metalloprotease [bacterium]|nr:M48 family metalloprotease [bacterium]
MTIDSAKQSKTTQSLKPEKPLSGSAHTALLVWCALISLLSYVFGAGAIAITLVVLAMDIALIIPAARIGLAGKIIAPTQAVYSLLITIIRSFKFEESRDCHIKLPKSVAPRLYELSTELASKIGVVPPDGIVLEMENNASVHLSGYRTGKGSTRLMIGFDMLAILSEQELAAIMAHELSHAKLINRGYRNVVINGTYRCIQMSQELSSLCSSVHEAKQRFYLAEILSGIAGQFAKLALKLVSAYMRQDEFAADRLAARICGAGACKSALLATDIASIKGRDLTFKERLMHLERDESFTDWLHARLSPADGEERTELVNKTLANSKPGDFNTHPTTADRLAMWGEGEISEAGEPAISLIRDPDFVARKIADEIERVISLAEQDDTNRLARWIRKKSIGQMKFTGWQALFIIIGVFTLMFFIVGLLSSASILAVLIMAAILVICVALFRIMGYSERVGLPFPSYRLVDEKLRCNPDPDDANDKEFEAMLSNQAKPLRMGRANLARYWADRAYAALKECDYKTALAASRLAIMASSKCDEALLANGVSEAYFGNADASNRSINTIYSRCNLVGTLTWGFGWAFALQRSWNAAEVYLIDAAARYPNEPTVLALLARCQWEREKLNEALFNIRRAVSLAPNDHSLRLLLTKVLLDLRRAKAANEQIAIIQKEQPDDYEVMLCALVAETFLGHADDADNMINTLLEKEPGPKTLGTVGRICFDAGEMEKAKHYLEAVVELGFSPSSLLCLANIEYQNENKERAHSLLLEALNVCKETLPDATPVEELLPGIFKGLTSCEESTSECTAWVSTIDLDGSPLKMKRMSLLVCAPNIETAKDYIWSIYEAMHPGRILDSIKVHWERAPKDQQPTEPISTGIYGFIPYT